MVKGGRRFQWLCGVTCASMVEKSEVRGTRKLAVSTRRRICGIYHRALSGSTGSDGLGRPGGGSRRSWARNGSSLEAAPMSTACAGLDKRAPWAPRSGSISSDAADRGLCRIRRQLPEGERTSLRWTRSPGRLLGSVNWLRSRRRAPEKVAALHACTRLYASRAITRCAATGS